jgi:hypothetical protein
MSLAIIQFLSCSHSRGGWVLAVVLAVVVIVVVVVVSSSNGDIEVRYVQSTVQCPYVGRGWDAHPRALHIEREREREREKLVRSGSISSSCSFCFASALLCSTLLCTVVRVVRVMAMPMPGIFYTTRHPVAFLLLHSRFQPNVPFVPGL